MTKLENLKRKYEQNKRSIWCVIGLTGIGIAGALVFKGVLKGLDYKASEIVNSVVDSSSLPKPELPVPTAKLIDFWVDPSSGHPMASVSVENQHELMDVIYGLTDSLNISDDGEVWTLVEWCQKIGE